MTKVNYDRFASFDLNEACVDGRQLDLMALRGLLSP